MIAIFKPINNWPWFDIRELHIVKWVMKVKRWVAIEDYINIIDELPVFKPLVKCESKQAFRKQFEEYIIT